MKKTFLSQVCLTVSGASVRDQTVNTPCAYVMVFPNPASSLCLFTSTLSFATSPLGRGTCKEQKKTKKTSTWGHTHLVFTYLCVLIGQESATDWYRWSSGARCSLDKCCSPSKGCSEPLAEECSTTLTNSTRYFHPPLSRSLLDSLGDL